MDLPINSDLHLVINGHEVITGVSVSPAIDKLLLKSDLDHDALTYLIKTPEPIGQQGKWLDFLAKYDITIHHRPGRVQQ